jgi:hypothetical protein
MSELFLRGLRAVATTGNLPSTFVLARDVFEGTAQVYYVSENLRQHVPNKDWKAARELLDAVVIGGKWVKEYGQKYGAAPTAASLPDPLRLKHALKSYEAYDWALSISSAIAKRFAKGKNSIDPQSATT